MDTKENNFQTTDDKLRNLVDIVEKLAISQNITGIQLNQLINYNSNQDKNLELVTRTTLKKYLLSELAIPESALMEYESQKLWNTFNGNLAVEWDGCFLVDYSELPLDFAFSSNCPKHNTVYLLESKQRAVLDEVLAKMPARVTTTRIVINNGTSPESISKKRKILQRLASQRQFFLPDPILMVVVASSKSINSTSLDRIAEAGYFAMIQSGEDFEVIDHRNRV